MLENKIAQKIKKKPSLESHLQNKCRCSINTNPNNCVYQPFLDGWSFVPDVGNGQTRGEVFTPRFIVDKMISDLQMFPKEAIYEQNYSTLSNNEIEKVICAKVLEPAVGTGNYISTILWHKIMFVEQFSKDSTGKIDVSKYHEYLLKAISSIYTYDIDPGNLESTYQRLFNNSYTIDSNERIDYWVSVIEKSIVSDLSNLNVTNIVKDSLEISQTNWGKFTNNSSGLISKLYEQHIGVTIPEQIQEKIIEILNNNIKLFNGIKQEDEISDGFICPGWNNVVWNWWTIEALNDDYILSYKPVRLADQIISGQIEQLENKIAELKNSHFIEKSDGLFSYKDWDNIESQKEYEQLMKEIQGLKKQLK